MPTTRERTGLRHRSLLFALGAYATASLLHYGHNAELLDAYPNMPAWITRAQVYYGWIAVTMIGATGYALIRTRYQLAGLVVVALYAVLGLDGLGHYAVASVSAHTRTMNVMIWLEVGTAILLLAVIVSTLREVVRSDKGLSAKLSTPLSNAIREFPRKRADDDNAT